MEVVAADEVLKLTLQKPLSAGQDVKLYLEFESELNDKMKGFYRSHFKNEETGEDRVMATTQFEATDARMAFPCWDEPVLKATFDVVLEVPQNVTALSNMNATSEENIEDNLKRVSFATSPIMSTYLLAFIVAELDYIEAFTTVGTPIPCRVYAPKGTIKQGEFSLGVCTRTLDLFNTVFGTPYPLPKMDMVSVADFDAGAMENWGLVTYRTSCLMVDEATTTQASKQWIASVVAHELAHQWFGNLVTMEWWSDLWLNEGFATWVGNYAVDKLFPDWHFWDSFVVDDVQRGMSLDCLRSSHPIEVEVKDPAQIGQIFDAISYSKGGSVIRMLSAYLTEDVFLEGIRQYLKKHAYSNASTGDLWAQLSETSGQDVSEFMNLWTKQTGYPVLHAEREGNTLVITQNRFLASGDANED
jgi:aminopeptidase 2